MLSLLRHYNWCFPCAQIKSKPQLLKHPESIWSWMSFISFWSVKRHQKATMDIQRPQSRKAASSRTWPALLRSFKFKVIEAFGWFWLTFMKLGSRRGFKPWVLDAFLGRRETCGISWSHLQCLLGSGINARMAGMLPVWRRTVKVEELST